LAKWRIKKNEEKFVPPQGKNNLIRVAALMISGSNLENEKIIQEILSINKLKDFSPGLSDNMLIENPHQTLDSQ